MIVSEKAANFKARLQRWLPCASPPGSCCFGQAAVESNKVNIEREHADRQRRGTSERPCVKVVEREADTYIGPMGGGGCRWQAE